VTSLTARPPGFLLGTWMGPRLLLGSLSALSMYAHKWTQEVVMQLVTTEVDKYKKTNGIMMKGNAGEFNCPLRWWRQHEKEFPNIAKLALQVLPIPATSAPSERIFSTAGLTITKDRARLNSDRVNELVFLHDSLPSLEHYQKHVSET
jgi:hypothetical protein